MWVFGGSGSGGTALRKVVHMFFVEASSECLV